MIAIVIAGIIASVALPSLSNLVRSATTNEAVQTAARVADYIRAYSQSQVSKSNAQIIAELNEYSTIDAKCSSGCLEKLITTLKPPGDAKFTYELSAIAAGADARTDGGANVGDVVFCIKGTKDTYDVLFSSHSTTVVGWDGNSNRGHYISGGSTPATAGGYCAADGTASASYLK
jgi:type II secretory pathway pseudopilin PulG